jgi:hypothetical protein
MTSRNASWVTSCERGVHNGSVFATSGEVIMAGRVTLVWGASKVSQPPVEDAINARNVATSSIV